MLVACAVRVCVWSTGGQPLVDQGVELIQTALRQNRKERTLRHQQQIIQHASSLQGYRTQHVPRGCVMLNAVLNACVLAMFRALLRAALRRRPFPRQLRRAGWQPLDGCSFEGDRPRSGPPPSAQ